MCASCGLPTVVHDPGAVPTTTAAPSPLPDPPAAGRGAGGPPSPARRFAALRSRDAGPYLLGAMLAMMADNVEHVITYWVLWKRFHSPALVGFEVISHWVPFLLLSVWFGSLADRHDCRRVVQVAQLLFVACSLAWGVLFATGTATVPAACVLLVVHGIAGALWGPGEQLLLGDFVGDEGLAGAVRLNATFKSLGVLCGPVVGAALLFGLGPTRGILVNAVIYLPLTLFLFRTRFTGHTRTGVVDRPRVGVLEAVRVLRRVAADRTLVAMIALGGLGSFFVGASLQSSMPLFAGDLGASGGAGAYTLLLLAIGAGGVVGGVVLEATGWLRQTVATAVGATLVYGAATLGFAASTGLALAVALLFVAGTANLVAMSVGQTVVQLLAPPGERGRVLGLYGVSASGLRAGSGFTVGLLGGAVGVHWSLGLSAAALCTGTLVVAAVVARGGRGAVRPPTPPGPPAAAAPRR